MQAAVLDRVGIEPLDDTRVKDAMTDALRGLPPDAAFKRSPLESGLLYRADITGGPVIPGVREIPAAAKDLHDKIVEEDPAAAERFEVHYLDADPFLAFVGDKVRHFLAQWECGSDRLHRPRQFFTYGAVRMVTVTGMTNTISGDVVYRSRPE